MPSHYTSIVIPYCLAWSRDELGYADSITVDGRPGVYEFHLLLFPADGCADGLAENGLGLKFGSWD